MCLLRAKKINFQLIDYQKILGNKQNKGKTDSYHSNVYNKPSVSKLSLKKRVKYLVKKERINGKREFVGTVH